MNKIKVGLKTSEFWLAILAAIITTCNEQLGLKIPVEGILGIVAITIAYISGRSFIKSKAGFVRLRELLFLLAISLVLASVFGCAGTNAKANAVASYEATGGILTDIQASAKSMCDAGTISAQDCAKLKASYNKTRTAYISAGNMLIVAINAEDAITREKSLAAYSAALSDVAALVPELMRTATELGIITGGVK